MRWSHWKACVLPVAAIISTAALMIARYLHEPIRKLLVKKARREIQVLGPAQIHLLSWHPSLNAEHVVIHNPPWMPAGIPADIGRISLTW